MDTSKAESSILYIAATQHDRNAMDFVLQSEQYMTGPNRQILTTLLENRVGDKPPDVLTLEGVPLEIITHGEIEGPAYVVASEAFKILRRASIEKTAKNIGHYLIDEETHPTERLAGAIEWAEKTMAEYGPGSPMVRKVLDLKEMGEKYRERELLQRGVYLGLGPIDSDIRGLNPGQVLTIGGKAGVGKTALALYIMRYATVRYGKNVLFISIEMPSPDIFERIAQAKCRLPHKDISERICAEELDIAEIAGAFPGIRVIDTDTITLTKLNQFIRMERRQGRADLVVIDYLQRMTGNGKNEYEKISEIARGVKSTAKLLDVPIILLSQISRKVENRYQEITLSSLRGSGQIEEAADYLLGVWVDPEKSPEQMVCKALKMRRSAIGVPIRFDLELETMNLFPRFKDAADKGDLPF
jgi:replicative DNA helicase